LPYGKSAGASITGTFGYTGQRIDAESGLYYYRARMYHPGWGRFLQPDPIGLTGGKNLYAYVGNDPLNNVDPSGLAADSSQQSFNFIGPGAGSNGLGFSNEAQNFGSSFQQNFSASVQANQASESFVVQAAMSTETREQSLGGRIDAGPGGPSGGGAPNFYVSPGGTAYPVPQGAIGPARPDSGSGIQFQGGSGGLGLDSRVTGFRFMDSQPNSPYQYPNGYGVYNNITGQTVNPLTGRTVPNSDPFAHIQAR
jgi:RHS repeat-associated protein